MPSPASEPPVWLSAVHTVTVSQRPPSACGPNPLLPCLRSFLALTPTQAPGFFLSLRSASGPLHWLLTSLSCSSLSGSFPKSFLDGLSDLSGCAAPLSLSYPSPSSPPYHVCCSDGENLFDLLSSLIIIEAFLRVICYRLSLVCPPAQCLAYNKHFLDE